MIRKKKPKLHASEGMQNCGRCQRQAYPFSGSKYYLAEVALIPHVFVIRSSDGCMKEYIGQYLMKNVRVIDSIQENK